ncbi:MAG: sigma-70 family RNA polymerase sigma factor, partial [Calditrichaeota bacterium]|nr:sigma-70 family RNA polymerase sigma factor [Calditrichota bacterium]
MTTSLTIHEIQHRIEFRRFYKKYYNMLKRYISTRIDNDLTQTEDMLQEVFLAILPNFSNLSSQVRRLTYAIGIAKNKLIDYYRYNSSNKSKKTIFLEENSEMCDQLFYENKNFLQETTQIVLSKMSVKYAQLLALKYFENYSIKEIANLINKSEKAVESLLTRARNNFESVSKKVLGKDYREQLLT